MPSIGPLEIAIVLIVVLVIFGPKRLPELGRSAGHGFRELRASISGKQEDERSPEDEPTPVAAAAADTQAQVRPADQKA